MENLICEFCGRECKNKKSLVQHKIRCKENPNKIDTSKSFNNKNRPAWNKGLTKENDERVKKQSVSLSNSLKNGLVIPSQLGKPHTEEERLKISNSCKKFYLENPDKIPYLLNHSSKESYPERYFKDIFNKEHLYFDYHKQYSKYQLDFINEDKKIIVEIDGDQHYNRREAINRDFERDIYFLNKGYYTYRLRWSQYKKLTSDQQHAIIDEIKELIQ